jgi:cytochrome oxidase Cu insertion factor (SCO1/SenC/PrrC family)
MAHSTDTYLLDAQGMLRQRLFFGAGSDLIAQKLLETAKP